MGHVTVTLNGRAYRLRCEDGEETRLFALADHVRLKVDSLVDEFGQVGSDRLLLMAALLIADEYFDVRVNDSDSAAAARSAMQRQPRGQRPDAGPQSPSIAAAEEEKLGAA
jgi:cell division protein ZapA